MKEKDNVEVQMAYLYLVKSPEINDISVCASKEIICSGKSVIYPTRYGMDLGIVIGPAPDFSDDSRYSAGRKCICGACHFGHINQEFADSDLLAMGQPPEFEFKPYTFSSDTTDDDSEAETADCWGNEFKIPKEMEVSGDVDWISHVATEDELKRYKQNLQNEKNAVTVCKEKILKNGLAMKLVTAHFLLSEPKVLFFFTSDDRVDFRELVKDLVSVFKMRIELRQIGVRDEARVLGGLAVCGRDFCCHSVSDKLNPVTIKMAKEQDMSLNSTKISGPCGRLLCCLSYEYDFYVEEKASYPPEGTKLKLGSDFYRVVENNILARKIRIVGAEGGEIVIPRTEVWYSEKNERWEINNSFAQQFLEN